MVYICYIIYSDYMMMCVLAVGDDELAVGDNDDTSSEVAVGRHVPGGQRTHVDRPVAWTGKPVPGFRFF